MKKSALAAFSAAMLLSGLMTTGCLNVNFNIGDEPKGNSSDVTDDIQSEYKTAEEIQAELDEIVAKGMFNISIASIIEFADGSSEGIAHIENVPGNRYDMQVVITDDDTREVLYTSDVLKPGDYIESIKLDKDLDAGTYPATATFTALDSGTNEELGKATAMTTIKVLS